MLLTAAEQVTNEEDCYSFFLGFQIIKVYCNKASVMSLYPVKPMPCTFETLHPSISQIIMLNIFFVLLNDKELQNT